MERNYFRGAFSNNEEHNLTLTLAPGQKEKIDKTYGSFENMLRQITELEATENLSVNKVTWFVNTGDGKKIIEVIHPENVEISPSYDIVNITVHTDYDEDFIWNLNRIQKQSKIIIRSGNACPLNIEFIFENEDVKIKYSTKADPAYSPFDMAFTVNAFLALLRKLFKTNIENKLQQLIKSYDFWNKIDCLNKRQGLRFEIKRLPAETDINNANLLYYSLIENRVIRQNSYPSSISIVFNSKEYSDDFCNELRKKTMILGYSQNLEVDILGNKINVVARCIIFNVIPVLSTHKDNQVIIDFKSEENCQPYTSFKYSLSNFNIDSEEVELYRNAKSLEELVSNTEPKDS